MIDKFKNFPKGSTISRDNKNWNNVYFSKPDTHENVLVSGEHMDTTVGFYGLDKKWWYYGTEGLTQSEGEVTKWRELPEKDF